MNTVDQAIINWANDVLEENGRERNATGIRFGTWVGCYSSWTCDYGVNATIDQEDGQSFTTTYIWNEVIEALPQYVNAQEQLEREHSVRHISYAEYSDYDSGTEVRW